MFHSVLLIHFSDRIISTSDPASSFNIPLYFINISLSFVISLTTVIDEVGKLFTLQGIYLVHLQRHLTQKYISAF